MMLKLIAGLTTLLGAYQSLGDARNERGSGDGVPSAQANKDRRANAFEVIVIDWEQGEQAKALAQAVQLRFPDAKLRLWNSNQRDLEPPFVMVQVREGRSKGALALRLLTHEGAVYTREVSASRDEKDLQERVARELTSTLLAIAEGLIEPDQTQAAPVGSALPDPQGPEPDQGADRSDETREPLPGALDESGRDPKPVQSATRQFSPLDQPALTPKWNMWLGVLGAGALPIPSFPRFFAGWGIQAGVGRSLRRRLDLAASLRWITRAKGEVRVHRLGVQGGVGSHWMPRTSVRYGLMGQLQVEAWWLGELRSAGPALPRPEGSQVLLGAAIEQSLTFRVVSGAAGEFWLGPQLVLGYAGLVGNRFSALAVYLQEPQSKAHALVRIGGVEMTLGIRAEFFRY